MFNNVLTHIAGGRFAALLLLVSFWSTSMAGASRVSFEEDELERILKAKIQEHFPKERLERSISLDYLSLFALHFSACHHLSSLFQFVYQN